eukprot:1233877-Rhodomonas_salina.1
MTSDPQQLQRLLDIVSEFAEWSGMELAHDKTEITACVSTGAQLGTRSIKYRGHPLPSLHPNSPFKYLGVRLTLTLDWKHEKSQKPDVSASEMKRARRVEASLLSAPERE